MDSRHIWEELRCWMWLGGKNTLLVADTQKKILARHLVYMYYVCILALWTNGRIGKTCQSFWRSNKNFHEKATELIPFSFLLTASQKWGKNIAIYKKFVYCQLLHNYLKGKNQFFKKYIFLSRMAATFKKGDGPFKSLHNINIRGIWKCKDIFRPP